MTSKEIIEKVKEGLADAIQDTDLPQGDAVIFVMPDSWHAVAEFLKNDADLKFDYFSDVRGVDYLLEEREPRFESVYQLYSCLLYTSPSPRDRQKSRMPSSA